MFQSKLKKEISKDEMRKKVDAWKTINSVLVQSNSKFMDSLNKLLLEKKVQHEQLKEKLEKGNASEEENANYIYLGGYVQCLKDILNA